VTLYDEGKIVLENSNIEEPNIILNVSLEGDYYLEIRGWAQGVRYVLILK